MAATRSSGVRVHARLRHESPRAPSQVVGMLRPLGSLIAVCCSSMVRLPVVVTFEPWLGTVWLKSVQYVYVSGVE